MGVYDYQVVWLKSPEDAPEDIRNFAEFGWRLSQVLGKDGTTVALVFERPRAAPEEGER